MDFPKIFWKYFDLYRRKKLTLDRYAELTGIPKKDLRLYLELITRENT